MVKVLLEFVSINIVYRIYEIGTWLLCELKCNAAAPYRTRSLESNLFVFVPHITDNCYYVILI